MICSHCKVDKPETDFPFDNKTQGTRNYACRVCRNQWKKSWYERNKEKHKQGVAKNANRYRKMSHQFILAYLSAHPCVLCGETDPIVLEFHHRDRKTKRNNVGRMYGHGVSHLSIEKEIAKCDVLCANCHKRQTLKKRREWTIVNG
jgi:hypothetical protein